MRERHRTLERLLLVKSQLHKMEEAKLDEIQRRKFAMEAEQRALLEMLGDVEKNDQLILGLACRHLVHTQKRESELVVEENEQKSRLLQRAAQKKALEKIVKETAREIDRDDEKRQLLDIGERLAAQAHSSLR
jgi:hypothetical protein